jgi:hypothetical protein
MKTMNQGKETAAILKYRGLKMGLRLNKEDEFEIINEKLFDSAVRERLLSKSRDRVAFVHFGKCGGVYINRYLISQVFLPKEYILNNSWWKHNQSGEPLGRDWSEEELLKLKNHKPFKRSYVHNHHNNWSKKVVSAYGNAGWFTFSFIREPKDLICSLYFFAKDMLENSGNTPIGPNGILAGCQHYEKFKALDPGEMTLDEFMIEMLSEEQQIFWKLPDYIELITYVRQLNHENFGDFLSKYFHHEYIPKERVNKSSNKGYKFYKENGLISQETEKKFNSHPEYAKYLKYLD